MKILAVEDDSVALAILETCLVSLGHEVICTRNGEEAWTALKDTSVRLVVCDWQMPLLDGLALCQRLRARDAEYVYFILLTNAEASTDNRDLALAAGVDDFLSKPIDVQDLKMRIHVAARILTYTSHIRQLESFIPICSYCKNVRDDQSYWQQIEQYVAERTGAEFSHSVCPDCYRTHVVPQLEQLGIEAPSMSSLELGRKRPPRAGA
jgi:phosphoserine phosphatase RsbU/P